MVKETDYYEILGKYMKWKTADLEHVTITFLNFLRGPS